MNRADLYVRVSTDEQADKGYSQRDQEERLRKYCINHAILIRNIIYEDHSAKTFSRPQWKRLLLNLKKNKNKVDILLFTKWDRFSRNTGDAYQMITTLRKLGVEPQSIEQPLDLSVPENKMMLAFYLAIPEVENDRRALNVTYGMRRAKKEGRYMGKAPVGYINRSHNDGSKYIAPHEPLASILRWAFEEISNGTFNVEQIYKQACLRGFQGAKSLFHFAIRNPIYCGRIFLPKYQDEESRYIKAQHEPIISEQLFDQVQQVLKGRGRDYKPKIVGNTKFPLRGFIQCPICGKTYTASTSKGRHGQYSYYHCVSPCKSRYNADAVNMAVLRELKMYIPKKEVLRLYSMTISEAFESLSENMKHEKANIKAQISEFQTKLSNARKLIVAGKIDDDDFRELKTEYVTEIERLEKALIILHADTANIDELLDQGIDNLMKLDDGIKKGELFDQRTLISAIYPENFTFDGHGVRTGRLNTVVHLIYLINKELSENKKGQIKNKFDLSCEVGVAGFEPTTSTSQMWRDTGLRYTPMVVSPFYSPQL